MATVKQIRYKEFPERLLLRLDARRERERFLSGAIVKTLRRTLALMNI
jgi:hypothetical protein